MLSLSTFFFLAYGLSFNDTTIVPKIIENTTSVYSEEPVLVAGGKGSRRRGLGVKCGMSPDVWALNICETDTFCYVAQKQVSLWLQPHKEGGYQRSGRTDQIMIQNKNTKKRVELRWPASQATFAWPISRMQIKSGDSYLIQIKRRRHFYLKKRIFLYQIPTTLKTVTEQAAWMERRGCSLQADNLLQTG